MEIKSLIIGILLTTVFFLSREVIGNDQITNSNNLGDIVVNSITVVDTSGGLGLTKITNDDISIFNSNSKKVISIKCDWFSKDGGYFSYDSTGNLIGLFAYGWLEIRNNKNKQSIYLDSGRIETNNVDGNRTAFLGTSTDGEGFLEVSNNKGEVYGSFSNHLSTYNSPGEMTSYVGTSEGGSGILELNNSSGGTTSYLGNSVSGSAVMNFYSNSEKLICNIGITESGGGFFRTYNSKENQNSYIGTVDHGHGGLETLDFDGNISGNFAGGVLRTYNTGGIETSYLGGSADGSGMLKLKNGGSINTYNSKNINTISLGSGEFGGGYVNTYNNAGIQTGIFGTNKLQYGSLILLDEIGFPRWSASAKD
jgi:hypothetical protein